jgi:hypothetical protein
MPKAWVPWLGVLLLVTISFIVDWISEEIRGLWPSALLVAIGWLFVWRTEQEMEPTFAGPEPHRPWLQATGCFFIGAGLLGSVLSLLPLLFG